MLKRKVCRVSEVEDEVPKEFDVPGLQVPVIVTRVDGTIIAGTAMCPHEDVSLARGCIEDGRIICSAHGYAFDIHSGVALHDQSLVWRTYRVTVLGEDVYVDLA